MTSTVTIEIPVGSEALFRQVLALHEEMNALALSAPDGSVLDACEEAVIPRGRDLVAKILSDAVARRIEAAEKRGPRSASVLAVGQKKIAGRALAISSRLSAS